MVVSTVACGDMRNPQHSFVLHAVPAPQRLHLHITSTCLAIHTVDVPSTLLVKRPLSRLCDLTRHASVTCTCHSCVTCTPRLCDLRSLLASCDLLASAGPWALRHLDVLCMCPLSVVQLALSVALRSLCLEPFLTLPSQL